MITHIVLVSIARVEASCANGRVERLIDLCLAVGVSPGDPTVRSVAYEDCSGGPGHGAQA